MFMRQSAIRGGIIVLPLLTLALLLTGILPDPIWDGPRFHFLVVSLTTLLSLVMALFMARAATQVRDVRVLFLALTYLSIASIFLLHALTTPGALVQGNNPWVGFSAWTSIAVGAVFFALSTVQWSAEHQRRLLARQGSVLGGVLLALLAYGTIAMTDALRNSMSTQSTHTHALSDDGSTVGDPISSFSMLANPWIGRMIALFALILLLVVIVRYRMIYTASPSAPSPLVAALLISAILLAQSQVSMALSTVWRASWWEYHVLMLAAFAMSIFGLVQEYAGTGSVQGVIEGLLLRDTLTSVQSGYTEVIVALVEAMEAKDSYTHGHTQRVAGLAVAIGRTLRLSSEELRTLNRASLLHDIGKIGVPDAILQKPGRLTADEFGMIREHPLRGFAMVEKVPSLHDALGGIRSHHERLDGSGYPDGLMGDAIPLVARIIAVADTFDALTSPRPYRGPCSVDAALAIVDAESGLRLDTIVVMALHRVLGFTRFTQSTRTPVRVVVPRFRGTTMVELVQ